MDGATCKLKFDWNSASHQSGTKESHARFALSSVITPNGGIPFGREPLVCRFLKGIFELKPCLPKYSEIWDVNNVLCYFKSCSLVGEMDLKDLTMNLATLLCLLTGQRCQTIHKINRVYNLTQKCLLRTGKLEALFQMECPHLV